MKKLLILAYDFPPYVSVGGLRPYAWYKYLHEFDVFPVVVTRQWDNKYGNKLDYIAPGETKNTIIENSENGIIIRTPYKPNLANRLMLKYGENKFKFVRKIISAYYEFFQWFFLIGPKSELYFAANEYLKTNKVDVIIATGDPFILFKYASKLSNIYNIPWIADYRDPWTQNKNNSRNVFIELWNMFFEKRTLFNVNSTLTVSDFFKLKISEIIKNKPFYIIPNGYNPEALINSQNILQNNKVLSIAFVGTIYNWHPIRSFISVISNFLNKNPSAKLQLNFYGINITSELSEMVSTEFPNIEQNINIYPNTPNNVLLQELAKNNLMLLFNYYSFMGTKIYDYLAIKRAILLCYSNDKEALQLKEKYYNIEKEDEYSHHLQEDLIKETNSGYIAQDSEHLLILLEKLYKEFTETGQIKCNTKNIEKYSRKYQTEKLAEIIKNI
ncbi:MAG: hypothetical protein A2X08_13160 [Bacteroidetes bacterium GWA2_32_17]|nr:MAG: hypothetical protein A2X08_13160 [Bacteroidetes bacterium GWA2_32_17]